MRNRRWELIAVAFFAAFLGACFSSLVFSGSSPVSGENQEEGVKVLKAQRFQLVDQNGVTRGEWGTVDTETYLMTNFYMGNYKDSRGMMLQVEGPKAPRISKTNASIGFLNEEGQYVLSITGGTEDPEMRFLNRIKEGSHKPSIRLSGGELPVIILADPEGKRLWQAP